MIETKEELVARIEKQKKCRILPLIKILNVTRIRGIAHANDVKISQEAINELARQFTNIFKQLINDTKEMEGKVILRRYVERRF